MSFNDLVNVLPPPITPSENDVDRSWTDIESRLGISLPDDYRKYIRRYGSGCIGAFIWPFNPFSKNENLNLEFQVAARTRALRTSKEQFSIVLPFPLYPQEGGLLPWGATDNGDVLFWLTEGCPNEWSVVINEARAEIYERYQSTMTDFLHNLISARISSEIIPSDFIDHDTLFSPLY